ncbi:hypothetical protein [Rhodobacter sp. SY28-1]|uniref:hypothetical protein n=1 Tax=Rhodobacter sp. SY28-1 TaxID=2562317 RepID=UPI0010C08DAF|nr:hypothetical protein [Rhodobacter sp. SY28-1]
MMHFTTRPATRISRLSGIVALSATLSMMAAPSVQAQAFRTEALRVPQVTAIKIEATNPDIVRVLAKIAAIRADLQLGLLFAADGLSHPEGSHFTHPRKEAWPEIKDAFVAAGGADLAPLLETLEKASTGDEINAAFKAVEAELAKTRVALNPTAEDSVMSLLAMARSAADEINPSGPTEVFAYQNAWAILMVARGELDLLARNEDPAIAKWAAEAALAFDDLILSMPDPNLAGPVEYDVAPINDLISRLENLSESA